MIFTLLIYGMGMLLGGIASFLIFITGGWSLWPSNLLQGLTYFFTQLTTWNFILNTVELLKAFKFLIDFLALFFSVKLVLKLFNFSRGSGEIDV